MSVRYRTEIVEFAHDVSDYYEPTNARDFVETRVVVERLCACTCGAKWWADVGSTTRCDGGIARFDCPVSSKPFEVPAC